MYLIYNIKRSIREFFRKGEIHHTKCTCGGDFVQVSYIETVGNIDSEYFCDKYNCKCKKCGKHTELDFTVET